MASGITPWRAETPEDFFRFELPRERQAEVADMRQRALPPVIEERPYNWESVA